MTRSQTCLQGSGLLSILKAGEFFKQCLQFWLRGCHLVDLVYDRKFCGNRCHSNTVAICLLGTTNLTARMIRTKSQGDFIAKNDR
ncbi:hypothetical protein AYI96_17620 [Shewanella sp. MSW]|nr:hypothetical protein AYI96_17620 [Shewanella sp. MSW]